MKQSGLFVISLDFELMWGMKDVATPEGYGMSHVARVPHVINRLLELFANYQVHATFGTVGLIMLQGVEDALQRWPASLPTYNNPELSPYEDNYMANISQAIEPLFFAPKTVGKLAQAEGVEVGTHTFGHFYCDAQGQTKDQFESDLIRAIEVALERDIVFRSIIFPRNNVSKDYLEICHKHGVDVYRGNAKKYFEKTTGRLDALKQRICRLVDAYVNLGGYTSHKVENLKSEVDGMVNVPASRLLRPFSPRLAFAERIRLRRIKKEMVYAAQHGELYHLWWHPHNFGQNLEKNMLFLEKVLSQFVYCRERYGMQSCTMAEAADIIRKHNNQ